MRVSFDFALVFNNSRKEEGDGGDEKEKRKE